MGEVLRSASKFRFCLTCRHSGYSVRSWWHYSRGLLVEFEESRRGARLGVSCSSSFALFEASSDRRSDTRGKLSRKRGTPAILRKDADRTAWRGRQYQSCDSSSSHCQCATSGRLRAGSISHVVVCRSVARSLQSWPTNQRSCELAKLEGIIHPMSHRRPPSCCGDREAEAPVL